MNPGPALDRSMGRSRSATEGRFSRSAAIGLLLLIGYFLGGPVVHTLAERRLPGVAPITRVVYAPLVYYAFGNHRLPGADWYLSYWVMCDHQIDKYD